MTSDIAPMNEYLVHDNSAFLVKDYENPLALANAIRKVCEDIPYHRAISAGAVKAAQPFDRKRVDAAEVAIYLEAINSRARVLSLVEKADIFIWQSSHRVAGLSKCLFNNVIHRLR